MFNSTSRMSSGQGVKDGEGVENVRKNLADIGWSSDDIELLLAGRFKEVGLSRQVKKRHRSKK